MEEYVPENAILHDFFVTGHFYGYYGFFKPSRKEMLESVVEVCADALPESPEGEWGLVLLSRARTISPVGLEDRHLAVTGLLNLHGVVGGLRLRWAQVSEKLKLETGVQTVLSEAEE